MKLRAAQPSLVLIVTVLLTSAIWGTTTPALAGTAPNAAPPPAPAAGYSLFLPLVAKPEAPSGPLSIGLALETAHAVTATIGAPGGVITATSAGGAHFRLELPAGALFGDEDIRMTPLSQVTGTLISGGLLAGVHLEPEGLQFVRPATLTIALTTRGRPRRSCVG